MKAYQLKKSGDPDSLRISEVDEPTPANDEVKIAVKAIGINYAEILSRRGQYRWAPPRPYIPGMEAFGTVVEVGADITRYKVGDKVICGGQHGAYAEFLTRKEYLTFPAIEDFSAEQNASTLVSYMTAYVALIKLARMKAGDRVLIQAAAGGVGTAACQIALASGGEVFGTASRQDKLDMLAEMGVHHPINYQSDDFLRYIKERSPGVDVVLEVVGGEVYQKSLQALSTFGRLVVVGYASIAYKKWNPLTWYTTWKNAPKVDVMDRAKASSGVMATHIGYLTENREVAEAAWNELRSFIGEHKLKPVVGKVFSFEDMSSAHRWVESRKNVGKTVVTL
jgi:NADPH2:quinone reductase